MKFRNKDYLTLIYEYNYELNLKKNLLKINLLGQILKINHNSPPYCQMFVI